MSPNSIPYSSDYRKVLKLAAAFAANTADRLLRLEHLFAAFLTVDTEPLRRLLNTDNLLVPERLRFEPGDDKAHVTLSSQVNRVLSLHGGEMDAVLKDLGENPAEIGLIPLAAALLRTPHGPVLEFLQLNSIDVDTTTYRSELTNRTRTCINEELRLAHEAERGNRLKSFRKLRTNLRKVCHGQDAAIDTLITRVASAKSQSALDRGLKPLSFVFLGGSGTGKSLVANAFRRDYAELFDTGIANMLDMTRFSVESLIIDLAGRDSGWKDGGKPGELTRLAAAHPNGVIILENIDKAHPGALAPIAKILTDGVLLDEFTKEEVSFADNTLIFTTNVASSYVDSSAFARICERAGGTIPRDKLLEGVNAALSAELPEKASILGEIFMKATAPVLFHRHTADSLAAIAEDHIHHNLRRLETIYGARVSANPHRLAAFFLETLQNLDSAHGLTEMIDNVLITKPEAELLLSDESRASSIDEFSITVDPLPALEKGTSSLAERTSIRLREAKRLDYDVKIDIITNDLHLRLTNLRHTCLPSIEDAGWFAVEPPNVSADDLVGLDVAWKEARRILGRLDEGNASATKCGHMLLYGPPGTGKTAFAKAIARTLGRSIISVNASCFTAALNPASAIMRLTDLFAAAERTRSVIFIDECDAFGARENVPSAQASVVNTLLTLLDGYEEHGVLVIGATNLPDKLDAALTRAGRLHSRIKIDVLRNANDRAKLVDIFSRKSGIDFSAALKKFIVQSTYEWAPANILSVLRRTADLADGTPPTREHFVKARIIDFAGEETQYQSLSEEDRRQVAVHEIGHAIIATILHHQWIQVSVNGFNHTAGFLETFRNFSIGHTREKLLETIDIALAGNAAERLLGTVCEGSESDFRKATKLARRALSSAFDDGDELALEEADDASEESRGRLHDKVNELLKNELERTLKLLEPHRGTLIRLADELVRKGTLFPDDFTRHLKREITR